MERVLVIGSGPAGAAAAIALARGGADVDVVELADHPTAHGSGLTLQGNALRVATGLGILDDLMAAGYPFNTLGMRAPDPAGTLLMEFDDVRMGGPDLPATLGLERPVLARVLHRHLDRNGVRVRFGTSFTELRDDGDVVAVTFSDGTGGDYGLVVGADGIRSAVRRALGIGTEPQPVGMGIWRVIGPRPASITRTDLIYGGPCYIAGFCPTSESSCYAYLVEDGRDRSALGPQDRLELVRSLAAAYHGPWDELSETFDDGTRINYTLFETHLVESPWHRGRVVLIGDAAHSCPPTLAQGAAMAFEDAVVLAEMVTGAGAVDDKLLDAFTARRLPRAAAVVDGSNQLARWLLAREQGDVPGLIARTSALLSVPA